MPKPYLSSKIKELIAERAKYRCEYCQSRSDCACESFESEHIIPLSMGGTNTIENLAFSCRGCNSRKSDRTQSKDPLTQNDVPLFNPRTDLWTEHFAWDETYIQVIGLTPVGRCTVENLKINRPALINLRRLMVLGGIHPPEMK